MVALGTRLMTGLGHLSKQVILLVLLVLVMVNGKLLIIPLILPVCPLQCQTVTEYLDQYLVKLYL